MNNNYFFLPPFLVGGYYYLTNKLTKGCKHTFVNLSRVNSKSNLLLILHILFLVKGKTLQLHCNFIAENNGLFAICIQYKPRM